MVFRKGGRENAKFPTAKTGEEEWGLKRGFTGLSAGPPQGSLGGAACRLQRRGQTEKMGCRPGVLRSQPQKNNKNEALSKRKRESFTGAKMRRRGGGRPEKRD